MRTNPKPWKKNGQLQSIIVLWLVVWGCLAIAPYSRYDWVLENLLIWAALAGLVGTYRLFTFTNTSYALLAVFLLLHAYGAYTSYNTTGFDTWMRQLFGTERDNYDRLVHFSFGLLCAYPIREALGAWTTLGSKWIYAMTCVIVLAMGAFYELIEMWVAFLVAPELGILFVGAQGDPWDAQHDMAVAMYGAMIAMGLTAIWKRKHIVRKQ
ncbi:DUF2238 domain-containing protein [Paenibacillus roseipurpureus]|uniref:DUF2238 domain-containing protein n=1 Tax=Paenibacillus roseopurpureus TaxID=2918901 RepID=A0AA96LRG3_9BACL|nr:DUF2238 domain-containing protein [Paenibacillus sp. MBLB1832]WNR45938.1 DUF2238 domain-containing protein [Paenibacillus sp. MBLB1832]